MSGLKDLVAKAVRVFTSLQERGIVKTGLVTFSYGLDLLFDWHYGTDTFSWMELEEMGIAESNREHAEMYQQTHANPLRSLFRHLVIPPGKTLVDFGCGKGRVLMIGAEHSCRVVRGIEFSPKLAEIAKNNCALFQKKTATTTTFEIIQGDAMNYTPRDDEDIFFLFNPFDDHVLRPVAEKIKASLVRRPRRLLIIYRFALHRAVIDRVFGSPQAFEFSSWGQDFTVFEVGATS